MLDIQKDMVKCFSYMSFLIELSKGNQMSGYDVMLLVKKFGGEVSPGTVYHQIERFKKNGFIKGIQDVDGKTNYEITDEGITAFKKFKDGWRKPIQYIHQNLTN